MDAQVGPGFSKAAQYDTHRATYSADAVEVLLENLQVSGKKNARILDLAAGTGKFTDALAARGEQFDIVAVEPLQSMRDVLAGKQLSNVEVKDGHASSIPLEEASVEAVVIAQVSHSSLCADTRQEVLGDGGEVEIGYAQHRRKEQTSAPSS